MNIGNVNHETEQEASWNALDVSTPHPLTPKENSNITVTQHQSSNIQILTTSEEAVKGFETAIKAAFIFTLDLILSEAIDSHDLIDDLLQFVDFKPDKKLDIVIENSRNIVIDAMDRQIAETAQLAVQILEAFLAVAV